MVFYMEKSVDKSELNDIDKVKKFLLGLNFICQSEPSSQNLIYSKKGNIVIIKNSKKLI